MALSEQSGQSPKENFNSKTKNIENETKINKKKKQKGKKKKQKVGPRNRIDCVCHEGQQPGHQIYKVVGLARQGKEHLRPIRLDQSKRHTTAQHRSFRLRYIDACFSSILPLHSRKRTLTIQVKRNRNDCDRQSFFLNDIIFAISFEMFKLKKKTYFIFLKTHCVGKKKNRLMASGRSSCVDGWFIFLFFLRLLLTHFVVVLL